MKRWAKPCWHCKTSYEGGELFCAWCSRPVYKEHRKVLSGNRTMMRAFKKYCSWKKVGISTIAVGSLMLINILRVSGGSGETGAFETVLMMALCVGSLYATFVWNRYKHLVEDVLLGYDRCVSYEKQVTAHQENLIKQFDHTPKKIIYGNFRRAM